LKPVANTRLVRELFIVGRRNDTQGEVGLKVTYDIRSKELKHAEEENRILRKLLSNKDIELEVQRELLKKKFWISDPRKI
jgi:putative transposase